MATSNMAITENIINSMKMDKFKYILSINLDMSNKILVALLILLCVWVSFEASSSRKTKTKAI